MFYNATIMSFFHNRQHAGEFPIDANNVFTIQVGNPGQSDVLQLQVKMTGTTITATRFKVHGGITTIAAAEYLCDTIIGVKIDDLSTINSQTIIDALQLPTARINAALLADDALQAIIKEISHGS